MSRPDFAERGPALPASLAALVFSAVAVTAHADEEASDFTLSGALELGGEYNSNVSVTELETATGTSDVAWIMDANLDLNWQASDRLTVDAGVSHNASRYQDADDFDLMLNLLHGDIAYQFDHFLLGSSMYLADARLGGDGFLTMRQGSLYVGKLLADQFFLRGAINATDKDFDTLSGRDADNIGLRFDGFWFFNEGRSSLSVGYSREDEDARQSRYAYHANIYRARYSHRMPVAGMEGRLQLGLRLQDRSYKGVTPEIEARRNDDQLVAEVRFDLSLNDHLAVVSRVEHGDYQSNFASADYRETRAVLGLRLSF